MAALFRTFVLFRASCALGILGALVLTGCATADVSTLQEEPGYVAGFSDGCQTVNESDKSFSTRRVRDDFAFDEDKAYRAGWRAGLQQCRRDYDDYTTRDGTILGEDQNF
ncbi:MAG: hypothetical protein AAFR20_00425 [Pseudomonadota bacterium]